MLQKKQKLVLSPYSSLYDLVIPSDHPFRLINELIDFTFVVDALKDEYCENMGRPAESIEVMFKYLFLKVWFDLSDRDIVERVRVDMSAKYFLGLAPEDDVINPSSLTKFRKLRLKNVDLLNVLLQKTVEIANSHGLLKSKKLIVDSTHTVCRFNHLSTIDRFKEKSKQLRKAVYGLNKDFKDIMPAKPVSDENLQEHLDYCKTLVDLIKNSIAMPQENIRHLINSLEEMVEDSRETINTINDKDAKKGHKSADTEFVGYKTHIGMSEERLITSAIVTTGEKHDGKQMAALIEQAKENGAEVEILIGDGAYSEKQNIEYARDKGIKLVSKLSKTVTDGNGRHKDDFEYNKDAGLYVCKAGHMAIKKVIHGKKKNKTGLAPLYETYFFDIEKCKNCPLREGCYKEGSRTKSFSVTIAKTELHQLHQNYQESEEFKNLAKVRYMIEAKNGELKNRHGFGRCTYSNLGGMQLQAAMAVFVVNTKRILKLKGEI